MEYCNRPGQEACLTGCLQCWEFLADSSTQKRQTLQLEWFQVNSTQSVSFIITVCCGVKHISSSSLASKYFGFSVPFQHSSQIAWQSHFRLLLPLCAVLSGQGRLDWTDEVDRADHEDKADRASVQPQQRGQFAALQFHEDGQLGVASSGQSSRLLLSLQTPRNIFFSASFQSLSPFPSPYHCLRPHQNLEKSFPLPQFRQIHNRCCQRLALVRRSILGAQFKI